MHSNTWKILMQLSMIRDQQQTFQHASYIIVLWQLEEWETRRIFRHSGIFVYDYHLTPRPVYFILHECRFSIILGLTWLWDSEDICVQVWLMVRYFYTFILNHNILWRCLNKTLYSTLCASWFQSQYWGRSIFFQSLFTISCHVCSIPNIKSSTLLLPCVCHRNHLIWTNVCPDMAILACITSADHMNL
jgi:hypothetical protein